MGREWIFSWTARCTLYYNINYTWWIWEICDLKWFDSLLLRGFKSWAPLWLSHHLWCLKVTGEWPYSLSVSPVLKAVFILPSCWWLKLGKKCGVLTLLKNGGACSCRRFSSTSIAGCTVCADAVIGEPPSGERGNPVWSRIPLSAMFVSLNSIWNPPDSDWKLSESPSLTFSFLLPTFEELFWSVSCDGSREIISCSALNPWVHVAWAAPLATGAVRTSRDCKRLVGYIPFSLAAKSLWNTGSSVVTKACSWPLVHLSDTPHNKILCCHDLHPVNHSHTFLQICLWENKLLANCTSTVLISKLGSINGFWIFLNATRLLVFPSLDALALTTGRKVNSSRQSAILRASVLYSSEFPSNRAEIRKLVSRSLYRSRQRLGTKVSL